MEESVVACSLDEEQLAQRRAELRARLVPRLRRARKLRDGIALAFERSPENERELDEFIAFEAGCCGFAHMTLRSDAGAGVSWLEIRGPSGTVEIFGQLLPPGVTIEPAEPSRGLLRLGLAGMGASLFVLLCCVTPLLGMGLAVLGIGAAAGAAVAFWMDATAVPLLAVSSVAAGVYFWRLRRHPAG